MKRSQKSSNGIYTAIGGFILLAMVLLLLKYVWPVLLVVAAVGAGWWVLQKILRAAGPAGREHDETPAAGSTKEIHSAESEKAPKEQTPSGPIQKQADEEKKDAGSPQPVIQKPRITFSYDAPSRPRKDPGRLVMTPKSTHYPREVAEVTSYVVLDTETTGLSKTTDQIIEIGLIRFDHGEEKERYTTLVNPHTPIPALASSVNHITDEDIADAPGIEEVLPDVLRIIGNNVVVGHNVTFDLGFLQYAITEDHEEIKVEYIDTVSLAKRAFPGLPNYKLETLTKELHLADSQAHRALDDVEVTAKLFALCRDTIVQKYEKELEERRNDRRKKKEEKARKFSWSPLLEKNFVFTGDFQSNREELEAMLDGVGANKRDKINGKTAYLVKGNIENLPQWAVERKYLKALPLSESGNLQIIGEKEYIELVESAKQLKGDEPDRENRTL